MVNRVNMRVERSTSVEKDATRGDQRLAAFMSPSFDASQFASETLSNNHTSPEEEIESLQKSIEALQDRIRNVVLENRPSLLDRTGGLQDSHSSFQNLVISVRSLQTVSARVKAEVTEIYRKIQEKTRQLRNLYFVIDLLRQTSQQSKIVERLKVELGKESRDLLDLTKIARLISEGKLLARENKLSGISICDENSAYLESEFRKIYVEIMEMLRSGMEMQSQAEIGGALQGLHNLQELKPSVLALVGTLAAELGQTFSNSLDAKKINSVLSSSSSTFAQISPQAVQTEIWERAKSSFEDYCRYTVSCWYLHKVLEKKKDPISHKSFIQLVGEGNEVFKPVEIFW